MTRLSSSAGVSQTKSLVPTRRRFHLITTAVVLAIILVAAVILVYTEDSYVKIEVTGTSHAYFVLSYDSTNVTIPSSQNETIEVLPHVDVTIMAYPNATYQLLSWHTAGGQVIQTENDTISIMTGNGGETVMVSAILASEASGPD
jgi:hypothetical protein